MTGTERSATDAEFEESFEDLYENAPCGYLTTKLDGTIVRVNATMLEWLGHARHEVVGRALVTFLQPGSQLLFETRFVSVLHLRGEAREVALSFRRADGSPLPTLVNSAVVVDADGSPRVIRTAVFDSNRRQEYERELLAARRSAEASEVRVRLLQDASSSFAMAGADDSVAVELAKSVTTAFAASNVAIYLSNERDELMLLAGEPAPGLGRQADAESHEVFGPPGAHCVQRSDVRGLNPALFDEMRSARVETLVAVPLLEGEAHRGLVVCSFRRSRSFEDADFELLKALGREAVLVVSRLRLTRQLEHLALYDQLTGLASRRLIQQQLDEAVAFANLNRRSMALVFVDLDGFKEINDEFGHSTGDSVLTEVGSRLASVVRRGDVVGRLGGDEFVVICEDTTPEDVDRIVARLHNSLLEPMAGRARSRTVTASIGVTLYDGEGGMTADVLLDRADRAMYRAKDAGKNQTVAVAVSPTGADADGQDIL